MTELRVLAKFVHDLKWDAVPDDVKETTKKVLIDSVGVGIGACQNEQNVNIIREFTSLCSDHAVSIWGQKEKIIPVSGNISECTRRSYSGDGRCSYQIENPHWNRGYACGVECC